MEHVSYCERAHFSSKSKRFRQSFACMYGNLSDDRRAFHIQKSRSIVCRIKRSDEVSGSKNARIFVDLGVFIFSNVIRLLNFYSNEHKLNVAWRVNDESEAGLCFRPCSFPHSTL